ncbi:MAG: hypothetical protein MUF34_12790 [Polyangiaceae bacterium]|jgi:hypothetical protein|nr:hypothetical protein [Polyangiaceae bacterium]
MALLPTDGAKAFLPENRRAAARGRGLTSFALGLLLASLAACGPSSDGAGAAGAPAGSVATTVASAPVTGSASASAAAATGEASAAAASSGAAPIEGAPAAGTYAGTYKAKPGAMTEVPKEGKVKAWATDPGSEAVGDGTLSVTVVVGQRAVKGEAKGALGDQLINGELEGKTLRARVDPSDPNVVTAMTGILTGAFEGDAFKGVLRVAGRNGNVVREGAVTLSKK